MYESCLTPSRPNNEKLTKVLCYSQILLVPTTEILINTRDRESGVLYSDLAGVDEFLGSHVLRVPSGGSASPMVGSRENRGKARQFTTFNGRTVVVKDSWVYSNKGGLSRALGMGWDGMGRERLKDKMLMGGIQVSGA